MKKLYGEGAFSLIPTGKGFIFTAEQDRTEGDNNILIAYKMMNLQTGELSLISRNVFLLGKFGSEYEYLASQTEDFINCTVVPLPDYETLIVETDGSAKIFDIECKLRWQGSLCYKDVTPAGFAVNGNFLWCSYPEANALVEYNIKTHRQEIRVGALDNAGIPSPFGLYVNPSNKTMIISSSDSGVLQKLRLEDFVMEEYYQCGEPVSQFFRIGDDEIILTKSGIYKL